MGQEVHLGWSRELFMQITDACVYIVKLQEEIFAIEEAWKPWLVVV